MMKGLTIALLLTFAGLGLSGCVVEDGHWHHHDWR